MVAQVNEMSVKEPDELDFAFSGEGKIVAKRLQETYDEVTYDFLSLEYTGSRLGKARQMYAFDIDLQFGEVKFPEFIANAQVSFLGNQLIIRDMDSDYVINFFVQVEDQSQNIAPKLIPEVVSAIRIVHETEGFDKRRVGCSCYCAESPFHDPFVATVRSCSCKSKCENTCSITCNGARQTAKCNDICPQQ